MTRLPRVSWRKVVRALEQDGFRITRQRGSHIRLRRDDPFVFVIVPRHKLIAPGTLRAILRQADLTPEEFRRLL